MPKRNFCCVYNCLTHNKEQLSLFSLPRDIETCNEWLRLIKREDLKASSGSTRSYRVCEKHFKDSDIMTHSKKSSLKKGALPVLCIPNTSRSTADIRSKRNQTKASQTDAYSDQQPSYRVPIGNPCETIVHPTSSPATDWPSLSNDCILKRLAEHRPTVYAECSDSSTGDENRIQAEVLFQFYDRYLNRSLSNLAKTQAAIVGRSYEDRKWANSKHLCLKLYYSSPDIYRFLQSIIFLPSIKTLKRLHVPQTTDIDEHLMATLKCKVDLMLANQKYCAVRIGTIPVQTNLYYVTNLDKIVGFQEIDGIQTLDIAKRALLMMVRGAFSKWELPVAYAFMAELNPALINGWIDKTIEKLFNVGLVVCALISDFRKELLTAARLRDVTGDRPYFVLNDKKIFYMFDPPQLITLTRNALRKYDFYMEGRIAKCKHINEYYNLDQKQRSRLTSQLTRAHATPNKNQKKKADIVKELFSLEAAAAMSTYIEFKALDASAKDTVELIVKMSNMLYCINYSCTKVDHELDSKERPPTNWVLKDCLDIFKYLKLVFPNNDFDATHNEKFIVGFQITINAILMLFDEQLAVHHESDNYNLRNLFNQGSLELFFKQFRKEYEVFIKPTCRRVAMAFKNIFVLHALNAPGKHLNRACDTNQLVDQLTGEIHKAATGRGSTNPAPEVGGRAPSSSPDDVLIKSADYNGFELPETDTLLFVSGYLLQKCLERHNDCVLMNNYVSLNESRISKVIKSGLIHKIELFKVKLAAPPDDFVEFVSNLETVFQSYFECQIFKGRIAESLLNMMEPLKSETSPCPCFPERYLKKLYIRLRIFHTLRDNNRPYHRGLSQQAVRFIVKPY